MKNLIFSLIIGSHVAAFISLPSAGYTQTNDVLAENVRRGSGPAFEQAGNDGRKDLISLLEAYVNTPAAPIEAGHVAARNALAKLGVKKYLDEIIGELTNSPNTAVFAHLKEFYRDGSVAEYMTKTKAFQKLAYVKDRSTVKLIASFLNDLSARPSLGGDVWTPPYACLAVYALSEMNLENAPGPRGTPQLGTAAEVKAWQEWWEQHKDYYEKLEFGKPLPPLPAVAPAPIPTNAPPPVIPVVKPAVAPAAISSGSWGWYWVAALAVAVVGLLVWLWRRKSH